MERFQNQPLRERPHLAVLFADKLGGFVVATALLRGLHEKYPGAVLDYFGGERTAELEQASTRIAERYSLYGNPGAFRALPDFIARREQAVGPYDLAINLDFNPVNALAVTMLDPTYVVGRCIQPDGRKELPLGEADREQLQSPKTFWAGENFLARFGGVVESNYIGEIFCRLAYVETDYHRTEVPTEPPRVPIPELLIATGATRSAKFWPTAHWTRLIERCSADGFSVGLLGAAPKLQQSAYGSASTEDTLLRETALIDLRGRFTLPQVAGALAMARACVAIDNGLMHLAVGVGTPTIAMFGGSSWDLWAPHAASMNLALPTVPCTLCRDNRYLNEHCLRESHVCMESIAPDEVYARLRRLLDG